MSEDAGLSWRRGALQSAEVVWAPRSEVRWLGRVLAMSPVVCGGLPLIVMRFVGWYALVGCVVAMAVAVPAGLRLLRSRVVVGEAGVLLVSFPTRREFGWAQIEGVEVAASGLRLRRRLVPALRVRDREQLVRLWPAGLVGWEGPEVVEQVEIIRGRLRG